MYQVVSYVKANDAYFVLGLSLLSLILLVYSILLSSRLAKMKRRRNAALANGNIEEIVNCLTDQSNTVAGLENKLKDVVDRQTSLDRTLSSCVRKLGIVRFNAYDDVGGEQSFALVMLDDNNNGVAVSSLSGRQDTRVYAKRIVGGEGERALSDEERGAFDQARAGQELSARI